MNNYTVAAAVALALGTATAAHAQNAACATPDYQLYVAGSSAAKPAFQTALAADLFAANPVSYSSSNGDFEAFCGTISSSGASNAPGLNAGSTAVIYYRAEGGSVVGALPIVSGNAIKFLDLTGPGCNASTTPSTSGTSGTNGTTDSWGGCVTSHGVELGVTDLEPSVFLASAGNYPTAYSTAAFGSASPSSLVTLASSAIPLFQQVFGIFVNTAGLSNVPSPLNLSKETVAAILAGNYRDWSKVPTASGGQVSSTSATIAIKNREAGSGTRTGASLYFLGQECTTAPLALRDPNSINDLYSTGDVLKAANSTPGAITYASIDNFGAKSSTLTLAQLSGVTPGNLAAASGQYDYWFEATAIPGNTTGTSGGINSPGGAAIVKFLTAAPSYELQKLATAPHAADINVIPGQGGNTATVPLTSSTAGTTPIYINPFTRSGNSCNIPAEEN